MNNFQQDGELETDKIKSKKGTSSVGTPVKKSVRKPRRQRQNSNSSDFSIDEWDAFSEINNPNTDMRPLAQNPLKKFFTTCLTTLHDEEEAKD